MRSGSLVVVGTGIRLVGQATLETVDSIKRARRLFYLVADAATEEWLRRLNPTATTLEDSYAEGRPRLDTYREITERILTAVRSGLDVCAAFYGHPGVFVHSSHEAIRRARREGFVATMLPAVSTEDCLFADVGLDPSQNGCQSFEATDFLMFRRRFDPTSALILWQVGVLGESGVRRGMTCRPERLRALSTMLRRYYPAAHRVVLYEAAQFPMCDPVIKKIALAALPRQTIVPLTTLYVPARPSRAKDPKIARWLDEQ